MALIYCPECKKQISDKAEACPHCGLPQSYFASKEELKLNNTIQNHRTESEKDYRTLRNVLISFDRDYSEIFNRPRYIPSSEAAAFYERYVSYVGVLKAPMVRQYIQNMSFSIGFDMEQSRYLPVQITR